ncbi:MAG: hypothetical protein M1830_002355 [Pleopsidium flavum]|nr:MAG: hypothetical protein M1830_002355 [Pleopsidium flavum]
MSPSRSARDISDNVTNSGTVNIHLLNGETRHWCLQKKLLRQHSPYFRKLLQDSTKDETLDGLEILKPDNHMASPQPFELVVQWLYLGVIDEVPEKSSDGHPPYNMFTYIRLWCLCDKTRFDIPALQALALVRMGDYYRKYSVTFDATKVDYIYKHTTRSSPLRGLVARDAAYDFMRRPPTSRLCDGRFGDAGFEYMSENVEFAVDVLYAIRAGLGSRTLPHAFEKDEDADVFSNRASQVGTELTLKPAVSTYGLGAHTTGVLTPDPTPNRSASSNDRTEDCSSEESPLTPSKAGKGGSAVSLTDKQ